MSYGLFIRGMVYISQWVMGLTLSTPTVSAVQ